MNLRPARILQAAVLPCCLVTVPPASAAARESEVVASASTIVRPPVSRMHLLDPRAVSSEESTIFNNESGAIDLCQDYVEAQLKYFRGSQNADGVLEFAQKIRSAPGRRDGLFWPIGEGEEESPLGPNIAAAAIAEQTPGDHARAFSGYYFKVLLQQGPAAVGGPRDYRVDGRLLKGFALLAWPAEYGRTGVRSFLVNQLGDVYARDLGAETTRIAAEMSSFDPVPAWTKVASQDEEE